MDTHSNIDTTQTIPKSIVKSLSSDTVLCLKYCHETHQLCERIIAQCLKKGGQYSDVTHIRSLRDASEVSAVAANFILRESPMHYMVCMACAETCLVCAQSCERFHDDGDMKILADTCRECAEACEQMSTHH